jgi:hypothetical protein
MAMRSEERRAGLADDDLDDGPALDGLPVDDDDGAPRVFGGLALALPLSGLLWVALALVARWLAGW